MPEHEHVEAEFLAKVHEAVSEADELIELYKESLVIIKCTPGMPEGIEELTERTLMSLLTLKVLTSSLMEQNAEFHDALDKVVRKIHGE